MNRVAVKRAIVTGGASGIGRACVELLAQEGAQVAIFDVNETDGNALARELSSKGQRASFWRTNVAKEAEFKNSIDAAAHAFGGIDILVNNAGIAQPFKKTEEVSEEEFDRLIGINLKGVFFGTKHSIPHMRQLGGGSIINICSVCGLVAFGGIAPYHAAKGGVRMMSKNDAIDLAKDGIRVNAVFPGWVWTGMTREELSVSGQDFAAAKAAAAESAPLGRIGLPEDIAWAVLFLASGESSFMTGSELVVDGGYTAR
jgi:NAD(P)-dependent dehydrogenase (short-subunit alcohol dehydrogenase family)